MWQEGQATEAGKTLLRVLETKEPKEAGATKEWARKIEHRFTFVPRIDDSGWREGRPKVKAESPSCLVLFVPGRHVRGMGFRLTTTAETDGQLQRAVQEVERWLVKEGKV